MNKRLAIFAFGLMLMDKLCAENQKGAEGNEKVGEWASGHVSFQD
jgi:hypothetical protein